MNADMVQYYNERAKEYEKIYDKPERQEDLVAVTLFLQDVFQDKNVFEIACGTGYWTEKIAETARSVVATDINDSVLEIARLKTYKKNNVSLFKMDIFSEANPTKHGNLFAGFIWSHIELQRLAEFIDIIDRFVVPGGSVVLIDNNYVEGSSHAVVETDRFGNTYQKRKLENGTAHKILKNFPSKEFVLETLASKRESIQFMNRHYYWTVKYLVV